MRRRMRQGPGMDAGIKQPGMAPVAARMAKGVKHDALAAAWMPPRHWPRMAHWPQTASRPVGVHDFLLKQFLAQKASPHRAANRNLGVLLPAARETLGNSQAIMQRIQRVGDGTARRRGGGVGWSKARRGCLG